MTRSVLFWLVHATKLTRSFHRGSSKEKFLQNETHKYVTRDSQRSFGNRRPNDEDVCPLKQFILAATNFPRGLPPKYRRRKRVSLPCSGWERVGHRRYDHQKAEPTLTTGKHSNSVDQRSVPPSVDQWLAPLGQPKVPKHSVSVENGWEKGIARLLPNNRIAPLSQSNHHSKVQMLSNLVKGRRILC